MQSTKELKDVNFNNLAEQIKGITKSDRKDNLLKHLESVFKTLILHSPDKALANFEEISTLVK